MHSCVLYLIKLSSLAMALSYLMLFRYLIDFLSSSFALMVSACVVFWCFAVVLSSECVVFLRFAELLLCECTVFLCFVDVLVPECIVLLCFEVLLIRFIFVLSSGCVVVLWLVLSLHTLPRYWTPSLLASFFCLYTTSWVIMGLYPTWWIIYYFCPICCIITGFLYSTRISRSFLILGFWSCVVGSFCFHIVLVFGLFSGSYFYL